MIYGNDYWWGFVIDLEEKRKQFEDKYPSTREAPADDYEEYVLIIYLLGMIYKYLTEGGI